MKTRPNFLLHSAFVVGIVFAEILVITKVPLAHGTEVVYHQPLLNARSMKAVLTGKTSEMFAGVIHVQANWAELILFL